MPEFRRPGPARAFRRPTLRARMTLLYGAVICAWLGRLELGPP